MTSISEDLFGVRLASTAARRAKLTEHGDYCGEYELVLAAI
jgi:hypothetical protein